MIAPEDHADDGSERFVVLDKLGAGGMGVVYRVRDQLDGREVALKTLQGTNARDLYRFKREFRSLCDLIHPNLCALHELHTADGDWFFTMELVHGASFIDWVRPSAAPGAPRTRDRIRADTVQVDRLRPALLQLCDAVHALHISGRLHRDLKPSNVLVEASGRVVVLDFGLVTELEPQILDRTHERAAVGTPAYMSPEQAADCPLTPASDWYSVGAMLYEALTGRRPWEGSADEVMRRKQLDLPPRPLELAPSSPPDLDALCMALLAPDPDARPDGHAVLRALDGQPSPATTAIARTSSAGPFVGRTAQLAVLHRAADDARRGGVAVVVRGASGMGKSALASRFLSELEGALALSGRCYERETVPFKTLDTLIDALTGVLLTLPEPELRAVLPRDITALRRMFPVLRRVPLIAEPAAPGSLTSEPQELRMRAWAALRWMLGQLAARRPLVLCVDDLQWGDLDSVAFLGDLISRADRPPVLVLLLYRSEEEEAPVIRELHRRVATAVAEDLRIID
ncbi:MAG: serine/threonine-protein kinase PknK, partial [Kofleriaceae bacterium]